MDTWSGLLLAYLEWFITGYLEWFIAWIIGVVYYLDTWSGFEAAKTARDMFYRKSRKY